MNLKYLSVLNKILNKMTAQVHVYQDNCMLQVLKHYFSYIVVYILF